MGHHVGLCRLIIMSADLCWQIVRNNHAYIMKRQNIKKPFSSEPNNLKNVNCAKFNGFCRQRVVGISEAEDKNGIVFTYKTVKNQNKPGKQIKKTLLSLTQEVPQAEEIRGQEDRS